MNKAELHNRLFDLQDLKYRDMQTGLIPSVDPGSVIGVRTPQLRALAKEILASGDHAGFLRELPHGYFEENQLHAFIISGIKDHEECMNELERFLPYVDNWATCDQMSPKVFKRHREELLGHIKEWIKSEDTYTVRFGIKMLMDHFLDDGFDPGYLHMVAKLRSDEYYVNMMIAWYFATALAKQYERVLPYIEEKRLDDWTHNKAIQKSIESRRIPDDRKAYLRSLRVKHKLRGRRYGDMTGRQVILTNRPFTLEELHDFMKEHWDVEEAGGFVVGRPTAASIEEYILLPATPRFMTIVYPRKAGGFLSKENKVILSTADTPSGALEGMLQAVPTGGRILAGITQMASLSSSEKERKGPAEEILLRYTEYMKKLLEEAGYLK